jgi:heat shock protein HspQ
MDMRDSPSAWEPGATGPRPGIVGQIADAPASAPFRLAKFGIGQVVKHRVFSFRGVVFDVDPVFANTDDWWLAIPAEIRPHKDQPFYHLLAENDEGGYVAYVSEQNLLADTTGEPVGNPNTSLIFDGFHRGQYHLRPRITH